MMRPLSSTVMIASGAVSASRRYCASPIASASCASASSAAWRRNDSSRTSCRAIRDSAVSWPGSSVRGVGAGHAQHAERQPAVDDERQRRVEPGARADLGRRRPTVLGRQIADDQRLAALERRMAEDRLTIEHRRRLADARLDPPAALVHERHHRGRRAGDLRGDGGQVVEIRLGLGVEDRARPQGVEPRRLSPVRGGCHGSQPSGGAPAGPSSISRIRSASCRPV